MPGTEESEYDCMSAECAKGPYWQMRWQNDWMDDETVTMTVLN